MTRRLSIRITEDLRDQLAAIAESSGRHESEVVREALEQYIDRLDAGESAYEMAKRLKLIGCIKDAPADLSTNPDHFEGFGKA